jgi:hypothetical protein
MQNTIDVPSPQPAEPSRRTQPPYEPDQDPDVIPSVPRPGLPIPEITNPVPGVPSGPEIVPPGTPFIP